MSLQNAASYSSHFGQIWKSDVFIQKMGSQNVCLINEHHTTLKHISVIDSGEIKSKENNI